MVKMRIGFAVGLTVGYYLGAMAGRERYQQINSLISKAKKSQAVDVAGHKAKDVIDLGYEKAKEGVNEKVHHNGSKQSNVFSPS